MSVFGGGVPEAGETRGGTAPERAYKRGKTV